jgi:hypothetical protein
LIVAVVEELVPQSGQCLSHLALLDQILPARVVEEHDLRCLSKSQTPRLEHWDTHQGHRKDCRQNA